MKISKTNAARFLDLKGFSYELFEYEVDDDLSAVSVSKKIDKDIKEIYKTIVCVCDSKIYIVACLQGDLELDLKSLAKAANVKKCELINLKDLEKITGYIRGGCSPLAMKKKFDTFIDARALEMDFIFVSAGVRGKQIRIKPRDLSFAIDAKFEHIARKP